MDSRPRAWTFRKTVNATFDIWIETVARDLERGQTEGTVRKDVDARKVAAFVVAAIEGSFGLARGARRKTRVVDR